MRKLLTAGVMVCAACGAMAQQADVQPVQQPEREIKVTLSADLNSAYVFRGRVMNNEAVLQPQIEVAMEMCSGIMGVRAWANHDLTSNGSTVPKSGSKLFGQTEVDYTLFYASTYEDFDYELGVTHYVYPYANDDNTTELYGTTAWNGMPCLVPFAALYVDVEEANGWYLNVGASSDTEISDALTAGVSVDLGHGNSQHNEYVYNSNNRAVTDLNLKAYASYAISAKMTAGAQVVYSQLMDSRIRRDDPDSEIVWGGVSLSYAF